MAIRGVAPQIPCSLCVSLLALLLHILAAAAQLGPRAYTFSLISCLFTASKCVHVRTCGHVYCSHCGLTLVAKEKSCLLCGMATKSKEVVPLQSGGEPLSNIGVFDVVVDQG